MGVAHSLVTTLAQGLQQLRLDIPAAQQAALLEYVQLLHTWNAAYNLTAIRAPQDMLSRHILDALVALPWLGAGPILDVGSGAGLPGIPLAIACPDQEFILLDSNGKKVRFIKQVVMALQIQNVDVVQSRVETYQPSTAIGLIVSRAFASLLDLVNATRHLQPQRGWLAWKGQLKADELAQVQAVAEVEQDIRVALPGVEAERHLVKMKLK